MTKAEIMAVLDEKGIEYSAKHTKAMLESLLPAEEEVTEEAADAVEAVEELTEEQVAESAELNEILSSDELPDADEFMADKTIAEDGRGHVTKTGLFLPLEATRDIRRQKVTWRAEEEDGVILITKNRNIVRKYSEEVHGAGYRDLATEFMSKR